MMWVGVADDIDPFLCPAQSWESRVTIVNAASSAPASSGEV